MTHIVVGEKVLVRDVDLPEEVHVGATVSCVYTGPGGEDTCNVVIQPGRVRVYSFADVLPYSIGEDLHGDVNRCVIPGCSATQSTKTDFCHDCQHAYKNYGYKKLPGKSVHEKRVARRNHFIVHRARKKGVHGVVIPSDEAASDIDCDESATESEVLSVSHASPPCIHTFITFPYTRPGGTTGTGHSHQPGQVKGQTTSSTARNGGVLTCIHTFPTCPRTQAVVGIRREVLQNNACASRRAATYAARQLSTLPQVSSHASIHSLQVRVHRCKHRSCIHLMIHSFRLLLRGT
jgi:hypothetical protein